ncbi:DNA repair protein RecN [Enterococcus faecalis]|jgi:DNA repair protein RecN (Recombination protein N)|uniref:DNA repair protein RecN n=3 Tax=Enterococcus faecalis TaxID=1351 RepID=A0A2S7LWP6_ENTFL|nr:MULTISPECIES: DNA repair protein RecN [Enterococcus]HAP4940842.1 DNA repair protein RecN [Enterococcus faecalis ADL-123]EEI12624.1 DNA repair protein RecN [Enterococcus faecalis TX0104]EGO2580972.1 DNA repair protein RecN [Enterococcus faecalis]EGO2662299.1 DNA repair protein RecN [Enterococcus faecalis]EGO2729983.1 DNA repair protein RecN [Enterococcus faecalis]
MLQELSVKNFAIISSLQLEFQMGMTVLTGETGAGKSIIIDAMGLLTGGRGSSDYIRQGANKCTLEGLFSMPKSQELKQLLEELGIETEEDSLVIQRDISASGKNVCRVNGRIVNITNLKRIGEYLVDIHGQNEHQELMQSERHIDMLDEFGGKKLLTVKEKYTRAYQEYRALEAKVRKRQKNEKEFAQRMDMLHFQSDEIASAQLVAGEEEQLLEERNKLNNFQKIADALTISYAALNGEDDSSLDKIGTSMNELASIESLDPEYKTLSDTVQNAYYLLQEASGDLSRLIDGLELDEGRLNEVENRLELIRQMKRKYGDSIETILSYYEEITKELAEADFLEGGTGDLEALLAEKQQAAHQQALVLRKERKRLAKELEQQILTELKELYLERTEFEVRFTELEHLQENGLDGVEFYITTNPGEPLKPLVRVASGGELSRVMLAMKTIFSQTQGITSIVFDEVDTGVSGRVAQAIADKIYQISENSQVLCITHLPQVAAVADEHYFIEKEIVAGRTETSVRILSEKERVNEIARMLAGSEITKLTIEHAQELLAMAKK